MENTKQGILALIATPIGNLSDISYRAVETLRNSQIIAAEDTRQTLKLLNYLQIRKPLISCRSFNEDKQAENIVEKVLSGENVSYVCDAGTPCISDPGLKIIQAALSHGIEPLIIPGPSALTYAATACAFPLAKFAFYGFLPVKAGRRKKILVEIKNENKTVFVYESPHRIEKLLQEIADIIGGDTMIFLVREATKIYEERLRGTVNEIIYKTKGKKWKGEIVVAIAPSSDKQKDEEYEEENGRF